MRIDGHAIGSKKVPHLAGNIVSMVSDRLNVPWLSTNQNAAFLLEVQYYFMSDDEEIMLNY